MDLDRGLIKQQAKTLINGKVGKIFLTYLIITLCTSLIMYAASFASYVVSGFSSIFGSDYGDVMLDDDSDKGYFDDFDYSDERAEFEQFGTVNGSLSLAPTESNGGLGIADDFDSFEQTDAPYIIGGSETTSPVVAGILTFLMVFGQVSNVLFQPLIVTLAGYFVLFIRGREYSLDDGLRYVFGSSFDKTYGKKLGTYLLVALFTYLWSLLFIIPGIVFAYGARFAPQIVCDNPEISPYQAIQLSKKMTKGGGREELFFLDLSFIPWLLLCSVTFGIASIYVIPYRKTTEALYYENFRIRALQMGRVTEDDFLSDEARMKKYMNTPFEQQNQYYTPENAQNVASQNAYYNPANVVNNDVPEEKTEDAPIVEEPVADEPIAAEDYAPAAAEDEIPTVEAENVTDEFE